MPADSDMTPVDVGEANGRKQAAMDTVVMENGSTLETVVMENGSTIQMVQGDGDVKDPEKQSFIQIENDLDIDKAIAKKQFWVEKLVFTVSVMTIVVLAWSLMQWHWLLPYYYTVSYPILFIIRFVLYWKLKYQYFLLDFCYFGNMLCIVYIWALPGNEYASVVIFGVANGPLAWATVMFRNSLVLHDHDRMTSSYIHVIPMYITYCYRWFPSSISTYWYTHFNTEYSEDVAYMFIWAVAAPFGCYFLHSVLYMVFVYCLCRPGPDYLNSFSYLSAKENAGCTGRSISCCGRNKSRRGKFGMFTFFNLLYGVLSLLTLPIWYKWYVAHTVYIAGVSVIVLWNGACYYMDVFAKKGHVQA